MSGRKKPSPKKKSPPNKKPSPKKASTKYKNAKGSQGSQSIVALFKKQQKNWDEWQAAVGNISFDEGDADKPTASGSGCETEAAVASPAGGSTAAAVIDLTEDGMRDKHNTAGSQKLPACSSTSASSSDEPDRKRRRLSLKSRKSKSEGSCKIPDSDQQVLPSTHKESTKSELSRTQSRYIKKDQQSGDSSEVTDKNEVQHVSVESTQDFDTEGQKETVAADSQDDADEVSTCESHEAVAEIRVLATSSTAEAVEDVVKTRNSLISAVEDVVIMEESTVSRPADLVAELQNKTEARSFLKEAIKKDDCSGEPLVETSQTGRNELTLSQGGSSTDGTTVNEDGAQGAEEYLTPYYLENFHLVIDTVLGDEFYSFLFNDEDRAVIDTFRNLSDEAQKLYIRLFQRKYRWICGDRISYPKIASDLRPVLQELAEKKLLMDASGLTDLKECLQVLPAPDTRQLAKSLRLNLNNQRQSDLVTAILNHSGKANISSFFSKGSGGIASTILKRAKAMLGACYKLAQEKRVIFIRITMLFSLQHATGEDDQGSGGQTQQLFQILMTNIGRVKYPEYEVSKKTNIYSCREDFIRFQNAMLAYAEIQDAFDNGDFSKTRSMYDELRPTALEVLSDAAITRHIESLPIHLREFTAGAAYIRLLTVGVDVLQRQRAYVEAVNQLEELLTQPPYLPTYRGRWYDRLALNTEQHLKQPQKALDIIKRGLADANVRFGHRYALLQRAQRICSMPSNKKFKQRISEFDDDPMIKVVEAPKVVIKGCQLSGMDPRTGPVWISGDGENVELMKRVEDVALAHYRDNGYPEGLHAEGGVFAFLFAIYLWDQVFITGIPDVFLNKYQAWPLDWRTDSFYQSRKQAFDEQIEFIRNSETQELLDLLEERWHDLEGTMCPGLNWERFDSLQHAQGLVECMGGTLMAAIFERMMKNLRYTSSGVADLTLWNTETKKFKMVEVKGPGDRLSTKQILWLDYLLGVGVDVEVCHVEAVSSKKLR